MATAFPKNPPSTLLQILHWTYARTTPDPRPGDAWLQLDLRSALQASLGGGQTSCSSSPKTGTGMAFRNESPDLPSLPRSSTYQSKATDFDSEVSASALAAPPALISGVTIWLQHCSANKPIRPVLQQTDRPGGGSCTQTAAGTSTPINPTLPKRCAQAPEGHLETPSKEAFSRPRKIQ